MKVERKPRRINGKRVAVAFLFLLISVLAGYFLQPLISQNENAINTVVTVFSILAGFLIAVITFIGDPAARGWKELQLDRSAVQARLRRHRLLFYLYLLTLGLALAMFLVPSEYVRISLWFERVFVGSAMFVFLASFTLPASLSALQLERYDAAVDNQLPEVLRDLKK